MSNLTASAAAVSWFNIFTGLFCFGVAACKALTMCWALGALNVILGLARLWRGR